jgi:hypothetical protein
MASHPPRSYDALTVGKRFANERIEALRSLPRAEGKTAPSEAQYALEKIDRYMKSVRSRVAALP